MVVELSNWEKFNVLSWKNFCVSLKTYKIISFSIMVPPLFCLILVFLRFLVDIHPRPAKEFRTLNVSQRWPSLLADIEGRREKIRRQMPDFNHNTFVPQPILAFAPLGYYALLLMGKATREELPGIQLKSFANCSVLREFMAVEHYLAAVCFLRVNKSSTKYLEYEMIYPSELRIYNDSYIGASWNTNHLFDHFNSNEKRQLYGHDGGYVGYIREGFSAIQNAISMSYIRIWKGAYFPSPKIRRFPIYAHIDDRLVRNIKISMSLVLICGFLFPVANCTNMIIKEKESQVRKVMKTTGISHWINFLAWFMKCFFSMAISSLLIVALLKIEWSEGRAILHHSSGIALIITLWAFNMAATSFSIMMSSFFSDSIVGVPLTCIIWLASYLPYVASSMNPEWLNYLQPLLCLSCNTVLGLLFNHVIEFEKFGDGFDLSDLGSVVRISSKVSPGVFLGVLYGQCILYFLIAIFIEELNPGVNDIPRLLLMFFRSADQNKRSSFRRAQALNTRQTKIFEIEPEYRSVALQIEKLTKIYNGVAVVKNVSLNLYEGDITVVMGHNGSGKTTLLLMIAGMVRPSSGMITIQSLDSLEYHENVSKGLGICLQDGLLFPELNIADQLTLFSRLRGLTSMELEKDVQKYLDIMNLSHRRSDSTKSLSNGEQRFLSVCCALAGNCKIILLDDPSKGLDVFSRKSLWELLRNERKERTIFLTTHSEEEAEALADRVAVLSGGELKCFGSTFFLKKIYGQGHRLICFKGKGFVTSNLTEAIQKYVPNISPECELGAQVSYILEDIRAHPELFDDLEAHSEDLGIQGITIAEVDSGDIFLRMGADNPSEGDRLRHMEIMNGRSIYTREYDRLRFMDQYQRLKGLRLFLNHCEVMMIKRLLSCLRIPLLGLLQLIMPILFTIASFSLLNYEHQRAQQEKLNLRLRSYPESITIYSAKPNITNEDNRLNVYEAYAELLFWLGSPHLTEEVPSNVRFSSYILEKQKKLEDITNNKYLIGATFSSNDIVAYFNNYPLHTVPITLNIMYSAIFRGVVDSKGRIFSKFSPLTFSSKHSTELKKVAASIGNYLAINISLCTSLTWSLVVLFLVRERQGNFKLLQFLSGVRGITFWLNNFMFDILVIVISSLIILLTIVLFELSEFEDEDVSGAYFVILIFSGTCMCSANYLISVISKDPVNAYIGITIFNIFGTMSYWCYLETYDKERRTDDIMDPFEIITRVLPHFSLCSALVKVYDNAEIRTTCKDEETYLISVILEECKIEPNCCKDHKIWKFKGGVFSDMTYIFVYGLLCWILLVLNETYSFWQRVFGFKIPVDNEHSVYDEYIQRHSNESLSLHASVAREERMVLNTRQSQYKDEIVICDRVGFRNQSVEVIKRLTFRVNHSECFVLLGHNASGKSTLIKMLVGHIAMSYGNAFIAGINVNGGKMHKLYKRIGYCPQDELCLSEYTMFEIMRMVSLLRGISNHDVVDTCHNLAKVLGFCDYLNNKLSICTPGVRRLFYCACALIGNPELILLDDATSSIDLAGRRKLWNIICRLRERDHSIIFTSVITQDCETIADRVAIMLNGRFSIISDPWTLNNEYAHGYLLKMKVKRIIVRVPEARDEWTMPTYRTFSANPFLKLATFIENEFPLSKVKDQLGNIVVYFIPKHTTTLSHIFEVMQRNAFILYVEDFLITRSSLSVMFSETIEDERYKQFKALQ